MENLNNAWTQVLKTSGDVQQNAAKEFAVLVRDAEVTLVSAIMPKVAAAVNDKIMENRKAACVAIVHLCQTSGAVVEMYTVPMLGDLLDKYADKKVAVRGDAKMAAEAVVECSNNHALRQMLTAFFGAIAIEKKWQTKVASLNFMSSLAATAPNQVASCLPDIIPEVSPCMWDTKKEVKNAATSAMKSVCIGNLDISPFIPSLISCIARPEEVSECVHKLASTTFVKTVDAPTLAIMLPLLIRGLNTDKTSVRRQTAVIIDNMCKLVEEPEEAALFLPRLLPLLTKTIESAADPELREVATRAQRTLVRAGGDDESPEVMEYAVVETSVVKCLTNAKLIVDDATKVYLSFACLDLIWCRDFEAESWANCVVPYVTKQFGPERSASLAAHLLELCFQESKKRLRDDDDDDGAAILCDCEFSLAYGGMILLNNTRLKLKRGHVYGLCGPNGCGKSTLLRAIANGQLDGFPSKDELKTIFVEHNLQASEAELNIVDFIMSDEQLAGVVRAEVESKLAGVGFTDKMRAQSVGSLSGGWKMKLELARAMLMNADILLLDEPTNHLDVKNVKWLEDYLTSQTEVTTIVVSHDSGFLDNVCTNIVHYDTRKLKTYKGNLSEFVKQVPEAKSYYELAEVAFSFTFPQPGFLDNIKSKGKRIMKLDRISYTYPGRDEPSISNASLAVALSSRVAVLGPNGAGKSTLIKVLTGEVEPQCGEVQKHPNLRFAYVAQHAFHHLEDHLDSTPNEYVQWRFQNGSDKELMAKASRQMTPEEKAQMLKVVNFEGEKRQIESLRSRRKMKKTFEYEVEWMKMTEEDNSWLPREKLEKWGFEKLLQITDDAEAARANLAARPVTSGVIQKHFEDFGLQSEFSTHSRIRGLSGGQKVKVVLGSAMWQNPHILVLDEPTNYLDRDSLGALAGAINAFGGGVVMISHSHEFTSALCEEVWRIEDGKLTVEGKTAVDNDTTKIEQKLEEISIDQFGNEVKTKMKRKLTRKELKQKQKDRKACEARGDYYSDSDDE